MSEDRLQAENEKIKQELTAKGVSGFLSARQKVERALIYVLVIATAGLGVGYVTDRVATSNVAACTNVNLGLRAQPQADDAAAQVAWAKSTSVALTQILSGAPRANVLPTVNTAFMTYVAQLEADQKFRTEHPLGKC